MLSWFGKNAGGRGRIIISHHLLSGGRPCLFSSTASLSSSSSSTTSLSSSTSTSTSTSTTPKRIVLGIETSFDDTAIGIVDQTGKILSNKIDTDWGNLKEHGGFNPKVGAEKHRKSLPIVLNNALQEAGVQLSGEGEEEGGGGGGGGGGGPRVSLIACTIGPGQGLSLQEGWRFARALCEKHKIPLIGVNHLEAHAVVTGLTQPLQFPFFTLLITGGHTELWFAKALGKYEYYGKTADDAIGEAYDKVARMLGVSKEGECGGIVLEKLATRGNPKAIELPVPMKRQADMNFSFAGLKSAIRTKIENFKNGNPNCTPSEWDEFTCNMSAAFQRAAVTHLIDKTGKALKKLRSSRIKCDTLVVCGGVAQNKYVQQQLALVAKAFGFKMRVPELCSDNGVMIAWTGLQHHLKGETTPLDARFHPELPVGPFARGETPPLRQGEKRALRAAQGIQDRARRMKEEADYQEEGVQRRNKEKEEEGEKKIQTTPQIKEKV